MDSRTLTLFWITSFLILTLTLVARSCPKPKTFDAESYGADPAKKPKIFDVRSYGAVSDNSTDNAKAFMEAWTDSCEWEGESVLLVPKGTFFLGANVYTGPCNGRKGFVVRGTLRSPNQPGSFFVDHWISFRYINGLDIHGGGTLDGQGAVAWTLNQCGTGSCPTLPVSLRLDFVNDSHIRNIKSINSKNFHINIFSCNRICIHHVLITAPADSPNTDGIHVALSNRVRINDTIISTGDDCISIGSGNRDIHVEKTFCGPGHGISVGSLGKADYIEDVSTVSVVNCTFTRTLNGVQIKTWPNSQAAGGIVSDFTYEDLVMDSVQNPIFINQQYCPYNMCDPQGSSRIQIRNITFRNIRGTSSSTDAVKLKCSESYPCHDIALENINLISPGGSAAASCSNVQGYSSGRQEPPSCFN